MTAGEGVNLGYAWEKSYAAVRDLASSEATLRERIASAYTNSLIRLLPERQLPADLQREYEEIREAFMTNKAQGNEGGALASARAMTDERAEEIAVKIVDFYEHVSARYKRYP